MQSQPLVSRIRFLVQSFLKPLRLLATALPIIFVSSGQPAWASLAATTTTLALTSQGSEVTKVEAGSVVTLTAMVKAGSAAVKIGQVNFCNAAAKYCTDIHLLGTAQLTGTGTAALKFRPGIGNHSYKAVFLGTRSDAASSSSTAALTVTGKFRTTTALAASGASGVFSLTATVAGSVNKEDLPSPTGEVSFVESFLTHPLVVLLGTADLGEGAAGLSFHNTANPATGSAPYALAVADFNGDGIPDLAVTDEGNGVMGGVRILLGKGDGTFTAAAATPATGEYPGFIAVGDFNGDGIPDLAVTNNSDKTVTVLLGEGDGAFRATESPSTGKNPAGIVVGDFNSDGILDLAVANSGSDTVTVLLGNGDGTFTPAPASPATGSSPWSIAAGDFNHDGILDLAVVNGGDDTVTVLLGKGDGTFTAKPSPVTGHVPMSIAVGDFNRDGIPDLAVANDFSDSVTILLGNGDGTFRAAASPLAGVYPQSLAVADFNGDGIADLAVANRAGAAPLGPGSVTVLLGNGNGTFKLASSPPAGDQPYSVAAADFNGDGVPDLAVANFGSHTASVLLARPTQTAAATISGISLKGPGPFLLDASYAGDTNYRPSDSGIVDFTPVAATPVLTPGTGTYHTVQTAKIADTTPGATIYYSLNDAAPATLYTKPITVSSTETVKAIAKATGYTNSAIASATYTIELPTAATPIFTPGGGTYLTAQNVTITDATAGSTIYYTTNGDTPTPASAKYKSAIRVSSSETIQAIAVAPNYLQSAVAKATYVITPPAATPVFTPGTGSYSAAQNVTITDATQGATSYYTADGTPPTTSSTRYNGAITVPFSPVIETLQAIAVAPGYAQSAVASATYTITPLVATPTFFPVAGTYSYATPVWLSDTTPNTTIYYTTNGQPPTVSSTKYTAGSSITVGSSETIQAIAVGPGNAQSFVGSAAYTITPGVTAPPVIATTPAQNGAEVVSLSTTTYGAKIYYTVDGTAPATSSTAAIYLAPFLLASNATLNSIALAPGYTNSPVSSQSFAPNIPSGTLVWSDEFTNATGANAQPNPLVWTYDTGVACCGNNEWEDYCAWGSTISPCNPANPNTYVGTDGYLHIVARNPVAGTPAPGNYTSARLKTQGRFSFQYGRFEARIKLPEAQGLWPAAWLLGNNITTVSWPACGEQDVQERIDAADSPDWNAGSIHATNLNNSAKYYFPSGQTAAGWHTYGMIWTKGKVEYYVDDPASPYAIFTPSSQGGTWPFDGGQANFIILNLAVGGDWPGPPNSTTPFPSEMLVDYVRVYAN